MSRLCRGLEGMKKEAQRSMARQSTTKHSMRSRRGTCMSRLCRGLEGMKKVLVRMHMVEAAIWVGMRPYLRGGQGRKKPFLFFFRESGEAKGVLRGRCLSGDEAVPERKRMKIWGKFVGWP